ncbi:MAG: cupin domain-containing protein [Candidatus Lokiarchaeota archaeon]|nr:cupin domain-containing protein [Candidatus Lokiarchaeota archaeon]
MSEDGELLSKVVKLSDLVEYQIASVVSRTIIDKTVGTVTIFAFDKGQGLSEHTTPYDAMVYILDGIAEITISGNPRMVKNGQMLIMPANEPHALKAIERYKMILIMIRA